MRLRPWSIVLAIALFAGSAAATLAATPSPPLVSHGKQINLHHGWIEVINRTGVTGEVTITRMGSDTPIDRVALFAHGEAFEANSCCYEANVVYEIKFVRVGESDAFPAGNVRLRACSRDAITFGYAAAELRGPFERTVKGTGYKLFRVDTRCPAN